MPPAIQQTENMNIVPNAADTPQTFRRTPRPETLAAIRQALNEADSHLREGTRPALIEVRLIAIRLAPLKAELPPGTDIRTAVAWLERTIIWWRNKTSVRSAWSWLNSEVGKAEAEASR